LSDKLLRIAKVVNWPCSHFDTLKITMAYARRRLVVEDLYVELIKLILQHWVAINSRSWKKWYVNVSPWIKIRIFRYFNPYIGSCVAIYLEFLIGWVWFVYLSLKQKHVKSICIIERGTDIINQVNRIWSTTNYTVILGSIYRKFDVGQWFPCLFGGDHLIGDNWIDLVIRKYWHFCIPRFQRGVDIGFKVCR